MAAGLESLNPRPAAKKFPLCRTARLLKVSHTESQCHSMSHKWKFFRAGGFDQVKLETGADLANLDQLDQKLWVALACPTTGLEFDSRTLQFIDTDKDGRVRASEIIAAAKWATGLLKNPDDLVRPGTALPLAAINDATLEGRQILASARQTLIHLGRPNDPTIALEDTTDTAKIFAATNFNGDGIIPVDAGGDDATKAVITEVIAVLGAVPDRSGKPGINQAKVDAFFAAAQAYSDWWRVAEVDPLILPLGEATTAAVTAWRAVKAKVDDYFSRCRLAAFDPRSLTAVNRPEADYLLLCQKDLSASAAEVAGFPISQVAAGKPLSLMEAVNPAWADALARFQNTVVKPWLGEVTTLTEADWAALNARFAAYEAWYAAKTGALVEPLGLPRVRAILASPAQATLTALILQDQSLETESITIASVEKLVRYYLHLHKLCVNFVNFTNFYRRTEPAIFQAGTLFLDQRSCDLCLTVDDAAKHSVMAGLAGAYLAYCDCVRKSTGEKLSIVAVFSQGDDDNLMIGRNGIFYDRKGRDFDATISKIITNPISLRQAFWSPYKKLVRLIEEQVAKRAADADADVNSTLATTAAAPTAAPAKMKFDPSVIALISVALGSLSAAFASVLLFMGKFDPWQIPLVLGGIMLIISTPSLILAYMKLRKRNLGPILDANGWAVNAKAKINVPLGTSLTGIAKLPPDSVVDVAGDKFAQHSARWPKFLFTAFILAWLYAFVDETGVLWSLSSGAYGQKSAAQRQKDEDAKTKAETAAANATAAAAKAAAGSGTTATPATATTNAPAAK